MKNLDVVSLSNKAMSEIKCYKQFVNSLNFKKDRITSIEEFKQLPIADKKSYFNKNNFIDLFPNKKFPPMIYASSGSSGKPTFWSRSDEQEIIGGQIHEYIFKNVFEITKKESVLVIVCFAMGVWVAGNYTLASCRHLSRRGYNLTTVTPGVEMNDILNTLREVAPNFNTVILAGYPPFVMDIINECKKKKITILNKRKFIITAGDKFTEEWRDCAVKEFGLKSSHHLISIYGSADAGILGHETPLTIYLRKRVADNNQLREDLFGTVKNIPAIFQYHPEYIYFETINEELILTAPTFSPLIRYNIHDTGILYKKSEILSKLNLADTNHKISLSEYTGWNLPFVIVSGRADIAVTFYAINIYPETIRAATENKSVYKLLSGNFSAYNKNTKNNMVQKLHISLELAKGVEPSTNILTKITDRILNELVEKNIEFSKLYSAIGEKARPVIKLLKYNESNLVEPTETKLVSINGKKPKIILSDNK